MASSDEYNLNPLITPSMQLRTMAAVLRRVAAVAAKGETPIIEMDLDLCALLPILRTKAALVEAGNEFGIDLFRKADVLPLLPGYTAEAWATFVATHGLAEKYPQWPWDQHMDDSTPFGRFQRLYWRTKLMTEDRPAPGLGVFVRRVTDLGGRVVFISGRWLPEHLPISLACLRRGGVVDPLLVIGNDRHESLVSDPAHAVSDAGAKVAHQARVQEKYGRPIAVVDDRMANRMAIVTALNDRYDVLSIAVAVPGFTCDPAAAHEPLLLSSFESFDTIVGDEPRRPLMVERYVDVGVGCRWKGLYEGLGRNNLEYALPRVDSAKLSSLAPYQSIITDNDPGSIGEVALIELCESTIPAEQVAAFDHVFEEARRLANAGLAAPFPSDPAQQHALRRSLVTSWLHSRDVETVMAALGYRIAATGVHDLVEFVKAVNIIELIGGRAANGTPYSPWLIKWVDSLDPLTDVNVGCMNPHMLVGMWQWTPASGLLQDAMDVHRMSTHHEGDGHEGYDPIEAAVNNLLHLREGTSGIRKEAVMSWDALEDEMISEVAMEQLGKSSMSRDVVRDAIRVARTLERDGWLTPWGLTKGAGF